MKAEPKQEPAPKPEPNPLMDAQQKKNNDEEGLSDGEDAYVHDPGRNRLTSVIDNIERMYDGNEDLGYDKEDSFIDDTELVPSNLYSPSKLTNPTEESENQYGGFFIHRGEIKPVSR